MNLTSLSNRLRHSVVCFGLAGDLPRLSGCSRSSCSSGDAARGCGGQRNSGHQTLVHPAYGQRSGEVGDQPVSRVDLRVLSHEEVYCDPKFHKLGVLRMKYFAKYLTQTLYKWNLRTLTVAAVIGLVVSCSNALAQSGAGSIHNDPK